MEHTDSGSFRENEEPDKKQKSRRPPSMLRPVGIPRIALESGIADDGGQIPLFASSA
jgi:hypothetical protein